MMGFYSSCRIDRLRLSSPRCPACALQRSSLATETPPNAIAALTGGKQSRALVEQAPAIFCGPAVPGCLLPFPVSGEGDSLIRIFELRQLNESRNPANLME
jgi:hypothetical protein